MGFAHRFALYWPAHHPLVLKPRKGCLLLGAQSLLDPKDGFELARFHLPIEFLDQFRISAMVRRRSTRGGGSIGVREFIGASAALEVAVHGRRLCGPTTSRAIPLLAHTDVVPSLIHAATESHVLAWTIEGINIRVMVTNAPSGPGWFGLPDRRFA